MEQRPLLAHQFDLKIKSTQATPNHLNAIKQNFWSGLIWSDFNPSMTLDAIQGGKTLSAR